MTNGKRRLALIFALALAHTLLSVWAMIAALGAAMAGFEAGIVASPWRKQLYGTLSDVLLFPLVKPGVGIRAPGLWGYLVFLANGLLWACVLVAAWAGTRRLRDDRARSRAVRDARCASAGRTETPTTSRSSTITDEFGGVR
jgi:hypothetical protein